MRKVREHQTYILILPLMVSAFLLLSTDLFSFTLISNAGKPARWPNGVVSYRFHTNTSGYFTGGHDASGTSSDEFAPIRAAFQTWASLPGLNLTISETSSVSTGPSSDDNHNTIVWIDSNWRSLSFRPPSNALAVTLLSFNASTGAITDADIYFNADTFQWAVVDSGLESGYIDVQNIATHEIGHLLGLDHSSETLFEDDPDLADATMFYASSTGETSRRDLKIDDERAIQNLYSASPSSAPTITSVSVTQTTSRTIEYTILGTNFNEYTAFVLTKNSTSVYDSVSRYKTIVSSTEATVQFDTSYLTDGSGSIVAFNHPSQLATYSVELTGTGLGATAAGDSGGGCAMNLDENNFSTSILFLLAMLSAALLTLRKKFLPSSVGKS